jgi:hypothetical protein
MKKLIMLFLVVYVTLGSYAQHQIVKNELRAPAFPLITIDPYTSAWSFSDKLYGGTVKHWTGKDFPLLGAIKVDNKVYRFMGTEDIPLLTLVPTSEQEKWQARYTENQPAADWMKLTFDDKTWKQGDAAFGTTENEFTAKTNWTSPYIWVRRIINIDKNLKGKKVYLEYSHDDDAIIYINGIKVVDTGNACKKNVLLPLSNEVLATLKKGKNIIAGYCWNRGGNALLDFGLMIEKDNQSVMPLTADQKSVDVQATQTHYNFQCGGVDLKLTFSAPLFMEDLKLLSRPVNYVSYEVASNDGKAHKVSVYFEASTAWALDKPLQKSTLEGFSNGDLTFLKTGSLDQKILAKKGDDLRIDWGYFYMAADKKSTVANIGDSYQLRKNFIAGKTKSVVTKRESATDRMAISQSFGAVTKAVAGKFMLGYDDIYSVQYFGKNLRPYWNADNDQTIVGQFQKANKEYQSLMARCYDFDKKLMEDAKAVGGKEYAELCALAYRQAITAHKLVEAPNGDLLFLSKENFSNGSIGTVDVTYPSVPLFLYYNPELAKGLMNFIYYYSECGKWTKPFPAHDVGTYPIANGQTYGGDMPVEEAGNMLILTAAVAAVEGNAEYAEKHWNVLTTWTDYLMEKGLDPENQLCTDDFAGHFAHNTNLSVKAIMGVASYAYLADMMGRKNISDAYYAKAKAMAAEWEKMANDGDHYRLTFDKSGTWSQKYNLVWDKLLKTNIFPNEIAAKEIKYYLTKQNKYGLPLDNRETYTKTDWIMWTATLANDKATFEQFIKPVYLFMNETTDRVPMSDWVYTDRPNQRGFQARSVVGGYFIKMLQNKLK